jgi:hypothetical protein
MSNSPKESHPDIKHFMTTTFLTKENIVLAYVARDVEMKLTGPNYFKKHLTKLGYTPESIVENYQNQMRRFLHEKLDELVDEENYYKLETLMNQWKNSKEFLVLENQQLPKQQRYGDLVNYLEATNEEFYNQLTFDELIYLGF